MAWSMSRPVNSEKDTEVTFMLGTVLLVVLVLALLGSLPMYPYSANWGYFPSGILGTVVVIWLIMVLVGRA